MSRKNRVTPDTVNFYHLLKSVKMTALIFNFSFLFSVLITVLFKYYGSYSKATIQSLIEYLSGIIGPASATLLGIVLTGLAILIALFRENISGLLVKHGLLQRFLFPFWFVSILWGVSTFICTGFKLFQGLPYKYLIYAIHFEIFIFIYALFSTVALLGHAIKVAIILADLENN